MNFDKLHSDGYQIWEGALHDWIVNELRVATLDAWQHYPKKNSKESGVVRVPMAYHPIFYHILRNDMVKFTITELFEEMPVMHLMNAFALPPNNPTNFQSTPHRDWLHGNSYNIYFLLDDFREDNGPLEVWPMSHLDKIQGGTLRTTRQGPGVQVIADAGSAVIFNSALVHRAGINRSNDFRCSINTQWTHRHVRQQEDYPKLLGMTAPEDVRDLLGYNLKGQL